MKDQAYQYKGKSMVEDMIRAARISVFFIDETQRVSWNDSGSVEAIEKAAVKFKAKYHEPLYLTAQYRCNGSTGYLNWLDDVLQISATGNFENWGDGQYEFKIFDRPEDLYSALKKKNGENKARLVAGYSWGWPKQGRERGTTVRHVQAGDLSLPWNYDGENWATSKDGINQVGCIHTSQGIEFDWLGVLIGADLTLKGEKVVGDPSKRAKTDKSLNGWKKALKDAGNDAAKKQSVLDKVQAIIKSTYKVLLSRGRKGCYVWSEDQDFREYLKGRLALASAKACTTIPFPPQPQVVEDPGEGKYTEFVPVYSLQVASVYFDRPTPVDCIVFIRPPPGIKIGERHFAAKVVGKSMEPLIKDGSYCLFRFEVVGSRSGRIVLAQLSQVSDPETGGSYTVKKYQSVKTAHEEHEWEHSTIQLLPINPEFKPIPIVATTDDDIKIIAEFIAIIP